MLLSLLLQSSHPPDCDALSKPVCSVTKFQGAKCATLPGGKKHHKFFLQTFNCEQVQVCRAAWLLGYGISNFGHLQEEKCIFSGPQFQKKKKARRDAYGCSDSEQTFIQWLIYIRPRQAKKIGDKLPHGHGDGLKGVQI